MLNNNLKQLIGCVLIGGMFFSCEQSSSSEANGADEPLSQTESIPDDADPEEELLAEEENVPTVLESQSVPNSDWQINNYANHLIGKNIAKDQASADFNNGPGWYYEKLDIKGGFASVRGAVEGWKEFVVWRMADGDDLVGEMTVECGPACGYIFTFYKGRGADIEEYPESKIFPLDAMNRHREEMTAKILEKYPVEYAEDSQLIYNFPQKGTGMRVDVNLGADEIQVPIIQLAWDKSIFYVDEFLNDPNPLNE